MKKFFQKVWDWILTILFLATIIGVLALVFVLEKCRFVVCQQ